jgi:hypothetical protein
VPLALGIAGLLKAARPRAGVWPLAALAYLGVLSHVGLDLLTPFGTAALWPLTTRRFALGWLYVIDPVVTAVLLTGLLVAFRFARCRTRGARGALAVLAAYLMVAGAMSHRAEAQLSRLLVERGIAPARAAVIPIFPGPLRWLGVAETTQTFYRARFWLGGPADAVATLPRVEPDRHRGIDRLPEVQAFRAFARFPRLTVVADGDARLVEYRDLAFEDHPFGGPMVLQLRLERSGAVSAVELGSSSTSGRRGALPAGRRCPRWSGSTRSSRTGTWPSWRLTSRKARSRSLAS